MLLPDIARELDVNVIIEGSVYGTGDSLRSSPFTEQSLRAMLQNLGISTQGGDSRSKNIAAVLVTANLPPFVQSGARIDVSVSSLGDATSLAGGTLVMTPLKAADGEIYAVAQGSVFVSGFNAEGQAEQLTQGVPTAGRVPNGAIIEREIDVMGSLASLVGERMFFEGDSSSGVSGDLESATADSATSWSSAVEPELTPMAPTTTPETTSGMPPGSVVKRPPRSACAPSAQRSARSARSSQRCPRALRSG